MPDARHFQAIDGRDPSLRLLPEVTFFARAFCPSKTLGIALSHRTLAAHFLTSHPDAPWCLILEDDAVPREELDLPRALERCMEENAGRDFVRLYCQAFCRDDTPWLPQGSTAAYLLSRSGAEKLRQLPVFWHVDVQMNAPYFKGAGRPLFLTRDAHAACPSFSWQELRFILQQPYLRVPGAGLELTCGRFLGPVLLLLLLACLTLGPCSHAAALLLTLMLSLVVYTQIVSSRRLTSAQTWSAGAVALVLLAFSCFHAEARLAAWMAAWLALLAALAHDPCDKKGGARSK